MAGRPISELPKIRITACISTELHSLLHKERNQSALIEELLRQYYSKPLEQLSQEAKQKELELRMANTYLTCMDCKSRHAITEWLAAQGDCPFCHSSSHKAYVLSIYEKR